MAPSPVVKYGGYVADPVGDGSVRASQRDIVILAAFEAFTKAPNAFQKGAAVHSQMTDHVMTEQQIDVPVGLEIGHLPSSTRVDLIFVAIDDIERRIFVERYSNFIKRMLRQQVVMIHEGDKLAGPAKRRIGRRRNVPFFSRRIHLIR